MDGLILIRKPVGPTSHDVVARLRKIFGQRKIGHFGTLDPSAAGLLLVALGKTTKFFPFFSHMDKTYEGRMRLGFSTDTYDRTGRPTSEESREFPALSAVEQALKSFEGKFFQLPPPYSAKKFRGKPLYVYARKNKSMELRPFPAIVHFFRLKDYAPPHLDFEVRCSSGTYIRTLAHDLGRQLGCGAHVAVLVRTDIGGYQLSESLSIEELEVYYETGEIWKFLRPMETLLPFFPKIVLHETGVRLVQNGSSVSAEHIVLSEPAALNPSASLGEHPQVFRLFGPEGRLLALARKSSSADAFAPFLVLI
jgi:tRNA pseudouridine55 synthase